jgi:putative ABC transport system permease protein
MPGEHGSMPFFRDDRRIRREIDEEIRFHVEMRTSELMARGLSEEEARRQAWRQFGDVNETRQVCFESDQRRERHVRRREYIREAIQDLTHGLRQLRRRPGFALSSVLTLALAIGATTAVFSVADHVVLRPLPYAEADRIVTLWETDRAQGITKMEVSPGNFIEWQERSTSFAAMGLAEPSGFDLTGDGPPESVAAWRVSEGFFRALGVQPVVGRIFTPEEFQTGSVVVISYRLWQARYGGDPSIIGRAIQLDHAPLTIVGVLPSDLEYPAAKDLWAPKEWREGEREDHRSAYMHAVARLRPGVSIGEAQAELDRVTAALAAEYPRTNATSGVNVVSLQDQVIGDVRPALMVLLGAVAFVLLIACANVASLLLARGAERRRELSVRSALGAGRGRILRQLVTESLVISLFGGLGGTLLALAGVKALVALSPPDVPRINGINMDARIVAFAFGVTIFAAILSGLVPALRSSTTDFGATLRGTGRTATAERERARLRGVLVVAQVALALVLLVGAGLLTRSFVDLLSNDPGFAVENRVALQMFIWDRNPTQESRLQRVAELDERLEAAPSVAKVAAVYSLPFHPTSLHTTRRLTVKGRPPSAADQEALVFLNMATPDYSEVMGVPTLRGRPFTAEDRIGSPIVAQINETLSRRFFPDEDPVGREIELAQGESSFSAEIVGVVGDVRPTTLDSEPQPEVYVPYAQSGTGSVTLLVQTRRDAAAMIPALRELIWQVDDQQAIYHAATVESMISRTLVERRFNLVLLGVFSLSALILAAVGIYGLVSFATRQRVQEIGVRLALGARPLDVVGMIVRQGMLLVVPGVLLGLVGALLLTRFLEHMLYGVTPTDPGTFLPVAALMMVVSLIAAFLPARRAAALDPVETLRET